MQKIENLNITGFEPLTTPRKLRQDHPASESCNRQVSISRSALERILDGRDQRLFAVVGPCSLHDPAVAAEYADRFHELAQRVDDRMLLLMRAHFEKSPHGQRSWTGILNDPELTGELDMVRGLEVTRKILLYIAERGIPIETEFLEPVIPRFVSDLISMAVVGAHTIESPTHRQMASGLSMPVGFKNGSSGDIGVATNAMKSARSSHSFLAIDHDGNTCVIRTSGNQFGFLILRGGETGPNYGAGPVASAVDAMLAAKLEPRIAVDCSHLNADGDYRRQGIVWNAVVDQRIAGNKAIRGLMLESNLLPGNQVIVPGEPIAYGVSITDGCLGWKETESLILDTYRRLGAVV